MFELNWNQRTNFMNRFCFPSTRVWKWKPSVIPILHLLKWAGIHFDWRQTPFQVWAHDPSWVDSSVAQRSVYFMLTIASIEWYKENSCEKIRHCTQQLVSPAEGLVGYEIGNVGQNLRKEKSQIYILCPDLSLIQILVYSNHYIHQKINLFLDILARNWIVR